MNGLAADIAAAGRTVRKAAGRRARDNGESLERALDAYHATLAARGVAWVRRVGAPLSRRSGVRPCMRSTTSTRRLQR